MPIKIQINIRVIKKKFPQLSMLYAFFVAFLVSAAFASGSSTTVYIYPETTRSTVGQNFSIEVKVAEINDLYGWEFKLKWNPNLLDFVDVSEGDFLKQRGDTYFTKKINNTEGYVIIDCTLLGNVKGVSDNGTLAIIEFYAKVQGECALDLCETILIDSSEQPIIHKVFDGKVYAEPKIVDFISLIKANIQNIIIAIIVIIGAMFTLWFFKFERKPRGEVRVKTLAFPETLDDEEKVVAALKSAGGQVYQSTLADRCGFSRSKTSKLLKEMEKKGKVRREEKGREKIVILTEVKANGKANDSNAAKN